MQKPSENGCLTLTEPEAARLLGISPRKLWSLRQAGEIPYIRFGRSVRYVKSQLEQWLSASQEGGAA